MRRPIPLVLAAVLASRLGPPAVAPTQTLAPAAPGSGPRSRGQYAVVFAGPRGVVENRAEPGVTVLFNRTMRSLDDDEEARVPALTVRTEAGADIPGKWRWIGTHGLPFAPDGDLPGATRFRVTVPRGTPSLEGEALASDYSFGFATPRPRMLSSAPAEGAATLRPDASIRVDWNQPNRSGRSGRRGAPARADGRRDEEPHGAVLRRAPRPRDPPGSWRGDGRRGPPRARRARHAEGGPAARRVHRAGD